MCNGTTDPDLDTDDVCVGVCTYVVCEMCVVVCEMCVETKVD